MLRWCSLSVRSSRGSTTHPLTRTPIPGGKDLVPGFGRQRADHLVMVRVWCCRRQVMPVECDVLAGEVLGVIAGRVVRVCGWVALLPKACHRRGAGPAGRVGVAGWSGSSSRQLRAHLSEWSRSRQGVDAELVAVGIGPASPPEAFQLAGGPGLSQRPPRVSIRPRCSRFLPALAPGDALEADREAVF